MKTTQNDAEYLRLALENLRGKYQEAMARLARVEELLTSQVFNTPNGRSYEALECRDFVDRCREALEEALKGEP